MLPRSFPLVVGFLLLPQALFGQDPGYEFRYHTYDESTEILRELASEYPDLSKLYSIGTGVIGDRELWCMEIGNQATGPAASKPAAYFDGNQHASEVTGGEVTLFLAHYLREFYFAKLFEALLWKVNLA